MLSSSHDKHKQDKREIIGNIVSRFGGSKKNRFVAKKPDYFLVRSLILKFNDSYFSGLDLALFLHIVVMF